MPASLLKSRQTDGASVAATGLTVHLYKGIGPISKQEWVALFPGHPDPYELVKLTISAGMDGFNFYSLVVRLNNRPVLIMPLFETEFPLSLALDGRARELVMALEHWFKPLLRPRIVTVGVMELEWGQVGIAPGVDSAVLDAAWNLALKELESFGRSVRAQIVGFWDCTEYSARFLPAQKLHDYHIVGSEPMFEVPIIYMDLSEFLKSMSDRDMADYLTRALSRSRLQVVRTKEPEPWTDRIYELYKGQVAGADATFGAHRKTYFENVCKDVPEAEYVLYFADSKLIGFSLLFRSKDVLIDKYVAIDPLAGREHKLFFISWMESIRLAIEEKIPLVMFGTSSEELKLRLGGKAISNAVVFKHLNPLLNWAFGKFKNILSYDCGLNLAPVQLADSVGSGQCRP